MKTIYLRLFQLLSIRDFQGREIWRKEKHAIMEPLEIGEGLNSRIILKAIGEGEIQMIKIIKTK